jgi:hypothetical protein
MAKNRPARVVIDERRRQVLSLMLQGHTPTRILNELRGAYPALTYKTVENDLCALNKALRQAATQLDVGQEIGRALSLYDELRREAWIVFDSATEAKARLRALTVLANIQGDRIKLLERAGVLRSLKQVVHEPTETWESQVRRLRELRGLEDGQ